MIVAKITFAVLLVASLAVLLVASAPNHQSYNPCIYGDTIDPLGKNFCRWFV